MRLLAVYVHRGAKLWECEASADRWKCGACGRGVVWAEMGSRCRVCRAEVARLLTEHAAKRSFWWSRLRAPFAVAR